MAYLTKPRIAAAGTITPAIPVGLLTQGGAWQTTANDPVFSAKMFGFSGVKFTTNIKLVVNSTPFQQGKLRLTIYPNPSASGVGASAHYVNRVTTSQLPGVDMLINDESVTMSVPWCSYQEYIDATGTIVEPLMWRITVFSPLLNGPNATITTANYTVWIWYTDVQLFGCSTASIVAQSKKGKSVVKRVAISEQEDKPLSSWLSSASKLASDLMAIPTIAPLAGPTSIMLSGLSGVASYFGYSRPTNGEPVRSVATHFHSALPNSVGVTPASVLAFNKDCKVKGITDFSPGQLDEMSINFVKRQWSFFDELTWSNTASSGTQLYKRDLNLSYGVAYGASTTLPPISLLSYLFRHYRGGIEILFKFVKTGFHSGSLAISSQYGTSSGANLLLTDTDPLYRTIVDIQEGDEVCISFPFIHPADFLQTYESFGTWYMHVMNPLICPETVAQSIVVQMYVRGAENLEFATIADENKIYPVYAQGGKVQEDGEITCELIGNIGEASPIYPAVAASTMGETCTSLLQVLKYGSQLYVWQVSAPVTNTITFEVCMSSAASYTKTGAAPSVAPAWQAGFMNVIRACYGFSRGGHEFSILHTDGSNTTPTQPSEKVFVVRSHISYGTPAQVNNTAQESFGCTFQTATMYAGTPHTSANHADHGHGAIVTYRGKYRVAPTLMVDRTSNLNDSQSLNFARITVAPTDTVIVRAADDFQCLFWLGVPPVLTGYV